MSNAAGISRSFSAKSRTDSAKFPRARALIGGVQERNRPTADTEDDTLGIAMRRILVALLLLGAAPALAQTTDQCSGHDFLNPPRAEGSCLTIKPQVYPSPDKAVAKLPEPK